MNVGYSWFMDGHVNILHWMRVGIVCLCSFLFVGVGTFCLRSGCHPYSGDVSGNILALFCLHAASHCVSILFCTLTLRSAALLYNHCLLVNGY